MRRKKLTALFTAAVLTATALMGCTTSGTNTDGTSNTASQTDNNGDSGNNETASNKDTSKEVKLKMFTISDAPLNQQMSDKFWSELDGILKEKLNCTVSYEYASGTNYQNNYQLALASGEKYDIIQSAGWLDYSTHATKGAFLPLEDLLPVYAPDIWEMIPESRWEEVKVDGHIYGIPSYSQDPSTQSCFMFREDLRKKYNCPEITDFESIAAYLQAMKDNEPGLLPSDDYQAQVYGAMFIPSTKYKIFDELNDNHSNYVVDSANPREVLATAKLDEFLPFMKMMKDWADRGFWSKSVLSSNEWGVFSVVNGKASASFNAQFPNYAYHAVQLPKDNPGWEIDYLLYNQLNSESLVLQGPATGNMLSVARTADNPERALMLANLLMTDKELNQFTRYGYENVNYEIKEGKLDTSNIDLDLNRFNYFPSDLFRNSEYEIVEYERYVKYDEFMEDIKSRYHPNVLSGFVLDISPVEAEYNAINQVRIEYGFPLMVGLVDDVDTAYADYVKKLEAAGLENVRQEFERQLNEYLDAK